MQTATNPKTGEKAFLVDGSWVTASKSATNDAGEKAYLVNNKWVVPGGDVQPAQPSDIPVDIPHRVLKGARDPITGLSQKLYAAVPESVQQTGTDVNKWLYDKTGGALGLQKPLPQEIAAEEKAYQKSRKDAGQTGFDWARLGGNIVSPTSLMAMGVTAPAKILPAVLQGMTIGGTQASMQPVYNKKGTAVGAGDVGIKTLEQAAGGAVVGGTIPAATKVIKGGLDVVRNLFSPSYSGDVRKFLQELSGDQLSHIKSAMKEADPGMTAQQALGKYVRAHGDVVGTKLARLEGDLSKSATTDDLLNTIKFKQELGRKTDIANIEKSIGGLDAAKARMSAEDKVLYGKLGKETVNPLSNVDRIKAAENKARIIAAQAKTSKIDALQNKGQMQTMAAQLAKRAKGETPTVGIVRKSSVRPGRIPTGMRKTDPKIANLQGEQLAPIEGNKWLPPRYKGQPRAPVRYAPQTQRSVEAKKAASDFTDIVSARSTEEQTANSIADLFMRNARVEDKASLNKFLNKPSFKKALKGAKNIAAERGIPWPKEGEPFTVEQLKLIKQRIAGQIKVKAQKGTITDQEHQAVTETLTKFSSWLKTKSKAFSEAESAHIKNVHPINRIEVAREMSKRLSKAHEGDLTSSTESIDRFVSGLREPTKMLKTGTGFARFKNLEQAVPEDAGTYKRIASALLNKQMGERLARMKESSLKNIDGELVLQLPHLLSTPVVIANAILKRMGRDVTPKIHKALSEAMSSPNKLLDVLEEPATSKSRQILVKALMTAQKASQQSAAQETGRRVGK